MSLFRYNTSSIARRTFLRLQGSKTFVNQQPIMMCANNQSRGLSIISSRVPSGPVNERGDYLRRIKFRAPTGRVLEIQIVHGVLADESTDAIVNPANPAIFDTISLNDISFSILERGGEELKTATHKWLVDNTEQYKGSFILPIGQAVAIPASGTLKSRYVIHAVGPSWSTEQSQEDVKGEARKKDDQLASAILCALSQADALSLQSISMPAISTFLNGGSRSRVSRIFFDTILNEYYSDSKNHDMQSVQLIRLVNDNELTTSCLCNEFDKRELANHPHCSHIHTVLENPMSDLPQPDKADSDRNSPWLAE